MHWAIMLTKLQQCIGDSTKFKKNKAAYSFQISSSVSLQAWVQRVYSTLEGETAKRLSSSKWFELLLWDNYDPTHNEVCTKRPKAQVSALALDELDINEVLAQMAIEDSLAYGYGQLSLNAKSGTDAGNAMKVRALVDHAPL